MKTMIPTTTEPTAASRLEESYIQDRPSLFARVRAAGRTLEEAEDILQDLYAEALDKIPLLPEIRNLGGWLQTLLTRRIIDWWRHDRVRKNAGETGVANEVIQEIIDGACLNPLDEYVQDAVIDALYSAIAALPKKQRDVIRYQVFENRTFREISDQTGISINTLTARKRAAVSALGISLRRWMEE